MTTIYVIGMIAAVALVIYLAYRGLNLTVSAIICAIVVMVTNQMALEDSFVSTFCSGAGSIVTQMFGLMVSGTILGAIYNASGAASSIAKTVLKALTRKKAGAPSATLTIIIVFCVGVLLAYAGIDTVALHFVLLPLVLELCREANIPRVMTPGIVMGSITPALCLPGSPLMQNVLCMSYLDTSSTAGLIPGFIGGGVIIFLNILFLSTCAKKFAKQGIGYVPAENETQLVNKDTDEGHINFIVALAPILVTFILFNFVNVNITFSVLIGCGIGLNLFHKTLPVKDIPGPLETTVGPCGGGILLACAAMGGFGAVVGASPAAEFIFAKLTAFNGPTLFVVLICMTIVVGVCASGPAGLGVGLPLFKDVFVSMGAPLAAIHRISSFTAIGLDSLPTNSMVIACAKLSGVSIRESYKYVGVCTVLNTLIGALVVTILMTLFPGLAV
ncbi:MAG: hypothetical protein LIO96_00720 [Lachnospiraceae bacterium]|nr:hypothetical protein [Lachnospiraceae bacterium]